MRQAILLEYLLLLNLIAPPANSTKLPKTALLVFGRQILDVIILVGNEFQQTENDYFIVSALLE